MNDAHSLSLDEQYKQIEEMHRFAEFGKISASVLHEVSSPLTAAMIYLEQISENNITALKESLLYLNQYIHAARNQLRGYSCVRPFDLSEQLLEVKLIVLPMATSYKSKIMFSSVPNVNLFGDPVKFQQILVNLIVNALEANTNPEISHLVNKVSVNFELSEHSLKIIISDKGQGMPEKAIKRIFDPLYSSKSGTGDSGLGLGLLIVRRNVEEHFGGKINVISSLKSGTIFTVKLPVRRD